MQNTNKIKKTHITYFIVAGICFFVGVVLNKGTYFLYPLAIVFFIFGAIRLRRYNKDLTGK